jgi:hypothetical protein
VRALPFLVFGIIVSGLIATCLCECGSAIALVAAQP